MFMLKVCFLGTLGEPINAHHLQPRLLMAHDENSENEVHYIVRLQPGLGLTLWVNN